MMIKKQVYSPDNCLINCLNMAEIAIAKNQQNHKYQTFVVWLNKLFQNQECLSIYMHQLRLWVQILSQNCIGMVQGQFRDMIKIFDIFGHPDRVNYVFLGGYVNKGPESIQTMCLLFLYKILKPSCVHLLRGSDQSESITKIFGMYDECRKTYGLKIWASMCQIFSYMPFGALIEGKIFCVHGGLSPQLIQPKNIYQIQNQPDVPREGLACDIVWSDPDPTIHSFQKSPRGISYIFGRDTVQKFLYVNNLDLLVRTHQIIQQGFQFLFDKKCLTLCSAPNYLGKFKNNAAILVIDSNLKCSLQVYKPKYQQIFPQKIKNDLV